MTPARRTEALAARARELGFDFVGVAAVERAPRSERWREWLAAGHHADMEYMGREPEVRADPRTRFDWVRSIFTVGLSYAQDPPRKGERADEASGGEIASLISRYARGDDYHRIMEKALKRLARFCRDELEAQQARYYVDTGPVLERGWAAASGLGFIGKNAMLIRPGVGSWVFLGEILLDLELGSVEPARDVGCGRCRLCIDACPTNAIVAPGVVDSRRCLSYLNIENRGEIPHRFRAAMGKRLFGCDICQEVCPFNATAYPPTPPRFRPRDAYADLRVERLIDISRERFQELFRGSAVKRAGWAGLRRNAMIVAANLRLPDAVPLLTRALTDDPDPILRRTAAWALAQFAQQKTLHNALAREQDPQVREAIEREIRA